MKSNDDKCHLIVGDTNKNCSSIGYIYMGNELIESEETVELQGVTIDNKLNFNEHVSTLIKKGNSKIMCTGTNLKILVWRQIETNNEDIHWVPI